MSHSNFFCCPTCHGTLVSVEGEFACRQCETAFSSVNSIPLFSPEADEGVFHDYAAEYDDARASTVISEHLNARRFNMFVDHLPQAGSVLELGCGTGVFLDYIAKNQLLGADEFERFFGVDLSISMLSPARRRLPDSMTLAQADSSRLPFEDGAFSMVFSQLLLHHIHLNLEEHLREMFRVLQPGGKLWLLDSNPRNPLWWFIMRQDCEKGARQIPLESLLEIYRGLGADDIQWTFHGAMPQTLPCSIYPVVKGLERVWERTPFLSSYSTHYLATCRKGLE